MFTNLCPFPIQIGDVLLPAHIAPLHFIPKLLGTGTIKTLVGFDPPEHLDDAIQGTVIVPRFAAAVAWAKGQSLDAYCIPLKHLGDCGAPGGVVLADAETLEPAPQDLAFDFPTEQLDDDITDGEIQRMVRGTWRLTARNIGVFWPVTDAAAVSADGSVYLPMRSFGARAVILPQDGQIIREALRRWPGVAVLVGVPDVSCVVDLYRVA